MITTSKLKSICQKYPTLPAIASLHNNADKFQAILQYKNKIPPKLYAYYLRMFYQKNTRNVHLDLLLDAFEGVPPKDLMTFRERFIYFTLPPNITIYRGTDCDEEQPRLSWSLNENIALKFSKGQLFRATISKKNVIAYFHDEREIVAYVPDWDKQ